VRLPTIVLICSAALASCTLERSTWPHETRQRRPPFRSGPAKNRLRRQREPVGGCAHEVWSTGTRTRSLPSPLRRLEHGLRTATASIEVDSLETAVAELRQLATASAIRGGAGVATGRTSSGRRFIEFEGPAGRFDEVVPGSGPWETPSRSTSTPQDVGEEYVDVTARIDNAATRTAAYPVFLPRAPGNSRRAGCRADLARVREEIERMRAESGIFARIVADEYAQCDAAPSRFPSWPLPVRSDQRSVRQAVRKFRGAPVPWPCNRSAYVLPLGFVAGGAWLVTRRGASVAAGCVKGA